MTPLRRFVLALQFLTVITLWPGVRPQGRDLAGSMIYYPVVGLTLGGLYCLARWLFSCWPPLLADALLVGLMVVLTRGLHLDGLADAADGLVGGQTREKALQIMKDSATGPFGAMAIALVLLVKWAALLAIYPGLKTQALLLAPISARVAMVLLCYKSPYARVEPGLASPFVAELGALEALAAGLIGLGLGVVFFGLRGGLIILGAAALAGLSRLYLIRRLGGITGDSIGALGELSEMGVLLAVASQAG